MRKMCRRILSCLLIICLVLQDSMPHVFAAKDEPIAADEVEVSEEHAELEQSEILCEITENRDIYSKEYLLSDYSREVHIYPEPIHFENENGAMEEIHNELVQTENGYQNVANSYDLMIVDEGQNKGEVSVKEGEHEVSWKLLDAETPTCEISEDSAIFNGYENGVSVVYAALGDGVKEDIHLPDANCSKSYVFRVQTQGLNAVLEDTNEIYFYDKISKEAVYYFPTPFLVDAEGEISYSARYELLNRLPAEAFSGTLDGTDTEDTEEVDAVEEDCVYVKITIAEEWFAQAAFPAILDPVLKVYRNSNVLDYGCVSSDGSVTDTLFAGKKDGVVYRSFVRFNLPNMPKQSVVTEALLYLNGEWVEGDTYYLTAKLVRDDWHKHDLENHGAELSWDFSETQCEEPLDYTVFAGKFDITKAVRQWKNGTSNNYGIEITAYDEDVVKRVGTQLKYSGGSPYLKITYRTTIGLENYWGTHQTSAGTAGRGYINDYTGALTVVNEDVATAGLRLPMSIAHIYNSNDTDGSNGWRINYERTIRVPADTVDITTYPYVYTDADGTEHYFKKQTFTYLNNGTGKGGSANDGVPSAADEDGLGLYIAEVTDAKYKSQYPLKLVNKSGSIVEYYDVYGRLGMITDSNQYENKTDATSTKQKNKLVITYENAGTPVTTEAFTTALTKASSFKNLCEQSSTQTTSVEYIEVRDELDAAIEALKTDAYTTCNYPIAKLVQEAAGFMDELTDNMTTVPRSTASTKALSIYNRLNSCITKLNTCPVPAPSRIATIVDAVGNRAVFHYENETGYLSEIEDPTYVSDEDDNPPCVRFDYTGMDLTGIVYPNGEAATYTYDSNHLLTGQSDQDGYTVSYQYDSAEKRVVGVSESYSGNEEISGATYGIVYKNDNTTHYRFSGIDDIYGTNDDIENIYVFDEKGRTTCVYSKNISENKVIGASVATYEEETESNTSVRNKIKDTAVVGGHSNNLLKNHSFEYAGDNAWSACVGEDNTLDNYVISKRSANKKYIGYYSPYYHLDRCTTGGKAKLCQEVTLTPGIYTLSAYCSAGGISSAEAFIQVCDESGVLGESDHITQDTDVEFDNGWVRLTTTFMVNSQREATVNLITDCGNIPGAGWVAFDCIQLEEGNVANPYNILEDGSFELTEGNTPYQWTTRSVSGAASENSYERTNEEAVDGTYCYRITGAPGKDKYLRTTAHVGYAKTGYVLSGWVKVNSTPTRDSRKLEMEIYHTYVDEGSTVESRRIHTFDTFATDWKYFCMPLPARQWTDIRITFYNNDLIGNICIDGLQLTKNDVQSRTYNSDGKQTSYYNQLNNPKYTYDTYKRMKKQVTAEGETLQYNYAANNDLTSMTSDVGPNVYYNYDAFGNVTWTNTYNPDATTPKHIYTQTTYTTDGNFVTSEMDNAGNITNYSYDVSTGDLQSVTLPGRLAGQNPVETVYTYNEKRLPESVSQGDRSVSYAYGDFEDLEEITRNGMSYLYRYDGFGNVLSVAIAGENHGETDPVYTLCENTYAENNGRLLTTTFANGAQSGSVYDVYGHLLEESLDGVTRTSYVYDNQGNVARQRDLVANVTNQYRYDHTGNVVRTQVYHGDSTSATDLESRMQYTYVQGGKLGTLSYQETGDAIRTYTYTYAKDGLPTKSTLPDASYQTYSYDTLRRNTKNILTPKSGAADSKKLYATMTYVDGVSVQVNNQSKTGATTLLNTYTNKFGSSGSSVSSYTYSYDNWGNITNIKDQNNRNRSYIYNDYGEIVSANEAYGNGTSKTYAYTYDNGGNIIQETAGGVTHTYTYADTLWKDLLTAYDGKAIIYDAGGYPTTYMGDTMTWDVTGKLSEVVGGGNSTTSLASGASVSYTYYADGKRKSKTVGGKTTTYHYNNGMLLSETTVDDNVANPELTKETIRYFYDSTGTVLSISYQVGSDSEKDYFFAYNGQGDVVAVYRSSDSRLIGTYDYDLWGRLISVTESSSGIDTDGILAKNPIRYRGYHYDNETGFYYLNARYYDPAVRRFISADDAACLGADGTLDSYNLFAYCDNNAVMGRDDSGHYSKSGVGVGGLLLVMGAATVLAFATGGVGVIALAAGCVAAGVGGITTYAAATESTIAMDVSFSTPAFFSQNEKYGVSFLIDFSTDQTYMYGHGGIGFGITGGGPSVGFGLVDNFNNPSDYEGEFVDVTTGCNLFVDHCWGPNNKYSSTTKATCVSMSPGPGFVISQDIYGAAINLNDVVKTCGF